MAMANLSNQSTGLGNIRLWISPQFAGHQPRLKVSNIRGRSPLSYRDGFSLSIRSPIKLLVGEPRGFSTKEMSSIYTWITLNEKVLIDYWDFKLDDEDLPNLLKPL
jgi:hypothetical protein